MKEGDILYCINDVNSECYIGEKCKVEIIYPKPDIDVTSTTITVLIKNSRNKEFLFSFNGISKFFETSEKRRIKIINELL